MRPVISCFSIVNLRCQRASAKYTAVAASLPTHRLFPLRFIAISVAGLVVLAFIGWDFFSRKPMSEPAVAPAAARATIAVAPTQTHAQAFAPTASEASAPHVSRQGADDH